jgi:hypothetical protein
MFIAGLNHIGHAASAISTVLNLPERGRHVAPTLLTLAGFTPVQVEVLIGGFVMTLASANLIARRAKSYLPNRLLAGHSRRALTRH